MFREGKGFETKGEKVETLSALDNLGKGPINDRVFRKTLRSPKQNSFFIRHLVLAKTWFGNGKK